PAAAAAPVRNWRSVLIAVGVLAVLLAAAGWQYWSHLRARPALPPRIRIAVLPVQNLTGDLDREYISDGLTEEIIAQLGRINPERLGVMARTPAMNYKTSPKPGDMAGARP